MDISNALAQIESYERRISTLRWKARWRHGKLKDVGDSASFVLDDSPEFCDGTVFFDFDTGRYRGEFERVSRWYHGAAPYTAHKELHSFDGAIYRSYDKSTHDTKLPDADSHCRGYIRRDRDPALLNMKFVRRWSGHAGLAWMPPLFWTISDESIYRFSDVIRARIEGDAPLAIDEENNLWMITTPVKEGDTIRIFCDPNRNCAVVSARWSGGDRDTVWRRLDINLEQVADTLWLPKEFFLVGTLEVPPRADRVTISDIELNPTCSEDVFGIQFPLGTYVEDGIADELYKVGPESTKLPWPCGCATTFGADPLE